MWVGAKASHLTVANFKLHHCTSVVATILHIHTQQCRLDVSTLCKCWPSVWWWSTYYSVTQLCLIPFPIEQPISIYYEICSTPYHSYRELLSWRHLMQNLFGFHTRKLATWRLKLILYRLDSPASERQEKPENVISDMVTTVKCPSTYDCLPLIKTIRNKNSRREGK